jgi:beta-galactosidase
MKQMVALRKQWDPHGGRVMGTRDNDLVGRQQGPHPGLRVLRGHDRPGAADRQGRRRRHFPRLQHRAPRQGAPDRDGGFPRRGRARHLGRLLAAALRLQAPIVPGSIGGRPGGDTYHWNSETFCLAAATRYASYVRNRIDNPDPAHSKWSAYAPSISDSDADGRQQGSYVLRVSGKVDGVRLPKELFFVSRVMQSEKPDLHIIGHWTYPANT